MTWTKISVDDVAAVIADSIKSATGPLLARIAELESKQSGVSGVKWAGVYRQGNIYGEGDLITDHGSLWLARRSTDARPGTSGDYTLIVKRGEVDR